MELVLVVLGYFAAWILLPVLTLGRVRVGRFKQMARWQRHPDGRITISFEDAANFGAVFIILAFFAFGLWIAITAPSAK